MEKNIFEAAAAKKYRFPFRGQITAEDLFDLKPEDLDAVYKTLNAQKKREEEVSLLSPGKEDESLSDKIEIVRRVFQIRQAEAEKRRLEKENADKKQRILEIIAKKQDAALLDMSEEELKGILDKLG